MFGPIFFVVCLVIFCLLLFLGSETVREFILMGKTPKKYSKPTGTDDESKKKKVVIK